MTAAAGTVTTRMATIQSGGLEDGDGGGAAERPGPESDDDDGDGVDLCEGL